jgi:tetratricopeptide (TPR) repeat protein
MKMCIKKGIIMHHANRPAKINVKLIFILIVVTVILGLSLFAARQIRRRILSARDLQAGQAAYEKKDWQAAVKNFREYLGRNPDDIEVLVKYAESLLSIRPLDAKKITGSISVYRRIIQLDPPNEIAYEKLATLYTGIGNFGELAHIAQKRLEQDQSDLNAPLWLADAWIQMNKKEEARKTLEECIHRLESDPEKHPEYVRACVGMSRLELTADSPDAKEKALKWLNKAIDYAPDSAEAFTRRAAFYRTTSDVPGVSSEESVALARQDLEDADTLGTDNPRIRYALGIEWMAHDELSKVNAELQAIDNLPQETLKEHFFDLNDWVIARFLLASELAARQSDAAGAAILTDNILAKLTERRHRIQVLPTAIPLYVAAGNITEARRCLDEYTDALRSQEGPSESLSMIAWLQALVAGAEKRPYVVIDTLQPVVVTESSRPGIWRLLASAYRRTDQPGRAVEAMNEYLDFNPADFEMTFQLAKEYSKLGNWNQVFESARRAESLNPKDLAARLLRIGASINLAAEQDQNVNKTKLAELSTELVKLRQEYPGNVDIRLYQSAIASFLKQPEKAESELKIAIQECEKPLRAELQLAELYNRTERRPEAIDVCKNACERHSEAAEPWLSLADLYVANVDHDAALSCLKKGLDSVEDKWDKRSLSIRLALLNLIQGDRSTGIQLLRNLAGQNNRDIRAYRLLLELPEIRQDITAAQNLIDELHQVEGESGHWWRFHQASLWLSSENWRSKQQDITNLLKYCTSVNREWSAPWLLLATMYERQGNLARVEETYRQALNRNPLAADIGGKLLGLLEKQSRFSDAEEVLQQIQVHPKIASAWQIRMAIDTKDYSRAIEELKLRISRDDQDASSLIQLARLVYQETRNVDQAFRYLKQAEGITPDSRTVAAVKAMILRLEGNIQEAKRVLDDYVARLNNFDAYWMRAVFLKEQNELVRAEEDYRKLTTFDPRGGMGYELLSNFYIGTDRIDQGVMAMVEGLRAYPENLRLNRRLMRLLFQRSSSQDEQRALEILSALEEKLPQDPELMTIRAVQLLKNAKPQSLVAAKAKLEKAVNLDPRAVNAHLALIDIAMQEGEYETGRNYAIRAIGSNPDHPALLSARGRVELALENIPMAVELARLVFQENPGNTDALILFGETALRAKDRKLLEEARTLLDAAVSRDSTNERVLLSRSYILYSLELPEAAIPELEAYCQSSAGRFSVVALLTLADLYRLSGQMVQSEKWIAQAEQLAPKNPKVIHARCLWLVSENRFAELADISSAYISANEQDPILVLNAARMLASIDATDLKKEGLKLFEHAATLTPTSIDAHLGIASTRYQMGQVENAETMYRELLEKHPKNIRVLNDFAWILQEHYHRYDEALELANKGLLLAPKEMHLLDTRGTILLHMPGRVTDAKKDFEVLLGLFPVDTPQRAKTLLQLGRVSVKLEDSVQAKQYLKDAMKIDQKMNVFSEPERIEINNIIE